MFGSNPSAFPPDGELKPSPKPLPNPNGGNGDGSGGLLLLLFPESGLLLFPKAPNPPNRFTPTIPKCEKCLPLVFTLLVALFCWLLLPAVASTVIPIG